MREFYIGCALAVAATFGVYYYGNQSTNQYNRVENQIKFGNGHEGTFTWYQETLMGRGRSLVEFQYGGKKHVFLETNYGIVRVGEYSVVPISERK